jgi:hypothetical protein
MVAQSCKAPVVHSKSWSQVADLDGVSTIVEHAGDENRRVPLVVLLGARHAVEIDGEYPAVASVIVQQTTENGIGVESRQATPDDSPGGINQRAEAAVSDNAQIE